jgi:outer membrane beta-barrel protein
MRIQTLVPALLAGASLLAPLLASAQQTQAAPANEQVVVPQVERREIKLPKFPSRDFEIGLLAGTYATENFGASFVGGLRLGYHITEDFFVQAVYAQTRVSDESFRQILPGGVFVDETETLSYYNLSIGYNILPGEVFIGTSRALPMQLYLIAGVGSTDFNDQSRQTFNIGFGTRVFLNDKTAVSVDLRNHLYSLDLLGQRQSTQNLELTAGLSYFF